MEPSERFKAIRAVIDRWLADDRGADYDDLAHMIDDALVEPDWPTDLRSDVAGELEP